MGEYKTGMFYHNKGSYPAANNRLQSLVDQYPLFSGADEALWQVADGYSRMGDRFEDKTAAAYTRIVKDYPLSDHVDEATQRLQGMNRPVPQADPVAYARMKYELENRDKAGVLSQVLGVFKHSPDTHAAAKSGTPAMAANRPTIPVSVPAGLAGAQAGGTSDVSVQTVTDSTALDTKPDARQSLPAAGAAGGAAPAVGAAAPGGATGTESGSGDRSSTTDVSAKPADSAATATNLPPPTNHQQTPKKKKKDKEKKKADTAQSQ
jgi:outer membrane protein assembly factor BamD